MVVVLSLKKDFRGSSFRKVRDDLVEVSDYLVQINTYSERTRVMTGPWQILLIWLNAQGEVMDYVWEVPLIGPSHPSTLIGYDNFGYPAVMALSLLNCHNVVQTTVRPEPKLDKVYRKRHHGHALMTFKRLVIEPVTKVASSKRLGKKTGIIQALHICRGHFRHYGIEGPDGQIRGKLFGKYSGRYWQPSCVKGSSEVGLIAKDYDVHALPEPPVAVV
jgi:ribosomal protein S14